MYKYEEQKASIFTESGARILIEMRDKIKAALQSTGAFTIEKVMVTGDAWIMFAVVDYLVEIGEIHEIKQERCAMQWRVFVSGKL